MLISRVSLLPEMPVSFDRWRQDQRDETPASKAEDLLASHCFTREQLHEVELLLIQIARVILFKPKLVLVSSDFFIGVSAIDSRIMELLMINLGETSLIAAVEDYSLLDLFSHAAVFDRGSIVEQGELVSLQQNKASCLNKLVTKCKTD